jgi:hypothetical protein
VLNALGQDKTKTLIVLFIGVGVGLIINILRRVVLRSPRYEAWKNKSSLNGALDFLIDATILASPYAASFGGFVEFKTSAWWALGGSLTSSINWAIARRHKQKHTTEGHPPEGEVLPEDMSPTSLVGGGLIAGGSLYVLYVGIASLIASGAIGKIFGG